MIAAPNPAQFESSSAPLSVKSLVEAVNLDPDDLKSDTFPNKRPSLHKRIPLALGRFLIAFCFGVTATLAWQSYEGATRQMLASSFPHLLWLAQPAAQNASETIAFVAPAAPAPRPPDQQQLGAISLDLDGLRRSVDRLSGSQEQMTRNVDQLAAGQVELTGEITKLQAIGQYILYKSSEPPPPQASAPLATSRSFQGRTAR
jgi:uncharacterized iron-regulated membrane protein